MDDHQVFVPVGILGVTELHTNLLRCGCLDDTAACALRGACVAPASGAVLAHASPTLMSFSALWREYALLSWHHQTIHRLGALSLVQHQQWIDINLLHHTAQVETELRELKQHIYN